MDCRGDADAGRGDCRGYAGTRECIESGCGGYLKYSVLRCRQVQVWILSSVGHHFGHFGYFGCWLLGLRLSDAQGQGRTESLKNTL